MKKSRVKLDFDELNTLDIYYQPMQIDIGSKRRRRELAEYLTDAFLFFFSTFEIHQQYNQLLQKQLYQQLLADRVSEAVTKVTGIDSYISDHIRQMSKEVVNTTFNNADVGNNPNKVEPEKGRDTFAPQSNINSGTPLIQNKLNPNTFPASLINNSAQEPSSSPKYSPDGSSNQQDKSDYWLSYRRAEDIAKSEANTFLNYTDYVEAKEQGATKKRWLTMLDDKVRQTHSEVEGQTIGIDEQFIVGNSQMRFPHDLESAPDPKEVIGCRCAVEYMK